jgi:hypothetical protein
MPSLRLVAVLLLIGCASILVQAQEQSSTTATIQSQSSSASDASQRDLSPTQQDPELQAGALAMLARFDSNIDRNFVIPVDDPNASEHFCLKMRSYVVARDSKDSDSVHLTHYSTCQSASKYRLKTTQMEEGVLLPRDTR